MHRERMISMVSRCKSLDSIKMCCKINRFRHNENRMIDICRNDSATNEMPALLRNKWPIESKSFDCCVISAWRKEWEITRWDSIVHEVYLRENVGRTAAGWPSCIRSIFNSNTIAAGNCEINFTSWLMFTRKSRGKIWNWKETRLFYSFTCHTHLP